MFKVCKTSMHSALSLYQSAIVHVMLFSVAAPGQDLRFGGAVLPL